MTRSRLFVVLFLTLVGCKEKPKPPAEAPVADSGLARELKRPTSGMDVSFLVVSDTHIGYGDIDKENEQMIAVIDKVASPGARGLVITGDLTEYGTEAQWTRWLELFGKTKLPVFEMVGNHDKVAKGPWVEQQVSARHQTASRFYSWDWDALHCVALQEGPDDDGLAFLEKDLAPLDPSYPLVIFFHLALLGPWSTGNWFDDRYKDRLYDLIKTRNVVALFHGHHHATEHYRWRGFDVWKPGAVKNGAHTFAIVHATDFEWSLTSYDWDNNVAGKPFTKRIGR
jgi:3',5'-cyclic AMP phosphodiesterase CpdA